MANDPVKVYRLTPEANIKQWCVTCNGWRVVWCAETGAGDVVTWCSTCGTTIRRVLAAVLDKPEVIH